MRTFVVCASLAALCAGCTVLTSDSLLSVSAEKRTASGVHYALPRGSVTLTIAGDTAGMFEFKISEPEFFPDPVHQYFLRYQPHPSYDDDITITMASGKPVLKKIKSTTEDKTKDIVVNLAKTISFFQASFAADKSQLLAQVILDPSDPKSVDAASDEIDTAMRRFVQERRRECLRNPPPENKPSETAACAYFGMLFAKSEAFRRGEAEGEALFTLQVRDLSVVNPQRPSPGRAADCSVGICYRPKIPYIIAYRVSGVTDTKVVELPNGAAPISIDISRAFLVKKVQEIEFDEDGFLTRLSIKKDSELLAAAQLPLNVLDAVLEGLQLRIKYTQHNTEIAKSEADLIKARNKLKKDQLVSDNKKKEEAAKSKLESKAPQPLAVVEALKQQKVPSPGPFTFPVTPQVDPSSQSEHK
jgi:hypothetical protein